MPRVSCRVWSDRDVGKQQYVEISLPFAPCGHLINYESQPVHIERVPVLQSKLNEFLNNHTYVCPGRRVRLSDFIREFQLWLSDQKNRWSRQEIVRAIDDLIGSDPAWTIICRGTTSDNRSSLGNLELPTHEFREKDGKLKRVVI